MPKPKSSFSTIITERGFWILFAITLVFFYRPLFNNETFFFRDLYNHFYSQKKLFAELIHSGQIPLWDPYTHGGQPFLANMNNSVLYPSNFLYLFLAPVTAFNIDIVLHVLLSALSAYVLARVINFNIIASITCGIIYGFSGPTLSIPNVWLYAAFHLPLMLALWHLYCVEDRNRWFVAAAIVGTIQVFAGRPELSVVTAIVLFLWTLAFSYANKFKKLSRLLLLELFILGISAIQLIPMIDLVQQSPRGQGIDAHAFFAWSVDPRRYPEFIIPNFLGTFYSVLPADLWGRNLEDLGMPYILSLYFGVPTLILVILGSVNKAVEENFPRRMRLLLVFLIVTSSIAIAGRHLPFFSSLFHVLPGISVFRYPVKFIYLGLLPIALLASWQLNYWLENSEEKVSRFGMALIMATTTILTIFVLYCFVFPKQAESLLTSYFGASALNGLRKSILHAAASSLLFMLMIILRTLGSKLKITAGISILIAADLLLAGSAINQYAPREFLTAVPDLAKFIKKEIANKRLYRDWDYGSIRYRLPSNESLYADRWRLEMLSGYTATQYGIPVVFHEDYDWLALNRMVDLTRAISKLEWQQKLSILSSAGVRFVLTSQQIQLPDLKLIQVINNASNKPYFLYLNHRCAQRTTFVTNFTVASSSSEILRLMSLPSFDPCKTVLLDEAPIATNTVSANASVKLLHWQTTSSIHLVTTDKSGLLVFSEPFTNGWRWKVDDWNVKAVRANHAFSAVSVPAGKHYVKRTYQPVSVTLGCAVSLTSLVFLGLFTFVNIRMRSAAGSTAEALP